MTEKIDVVLDKAIEDVEKQLNVNFKNNKWEIVHSDILKTPEGCLVKSYFGVTSAYGGVTVGSFLTDGGGFTPYFFKLTEVEELKTRIEIIVTGSERATGDSAGRNKSVAEVLYKMCQCDYDKQTPVKVVKDMFKNIF